MVALLGMHSLCATVLQHFSLQWGIMELRDDRDLREHVLSFINEAREVKVTQLIIVELG